MRDDGSSEGDDEGAGSEGPGDSGEEIEDENFGSVAKPVARGSYNGRENEMVIGQGAGVAKKTVNRKLTFDLAAKDLGRPLTMSEKKVLAQMSPAELKQANEGQGAGLVEMIKGLPGCKDAASEVNSMILKDGHDINSLSVFIVCLAALDENAIPGTPDGIGAQGPAGLARRLETLRHMGRINGAGKKEAEARPARSEPRDGGEAFGAGFREAMEATQEVASFTRAEEQSAAGFVEAYRRDSGRGATRQPFSDEQAAQVLKAVGPGSLDEETKEDIKQLLADIKGRTRRESGAAPGSPTVAVQRKGTGGASAGMGAASPGGRTYCSKYIKGECSSSAACGPTPGHGGGPSASARGGKEGREEEGRKEG